MIRTAIREVGRMIIEHQALRVSATKVASETDITRAKGQVFFNKIRSSWNIKAPEGLTISLRAAASQARVNFSDMRSRSVNKHATEHAITPVEFELGKKS
ncbi:MAG: hypothetical protein ABI810_02820 [Sphingomonas bacterium]